MAHLLRDLTAAHLGPLWQDSSTPTGFVHINKELTAHRPIVVLYDESCKSLCSYMNCKRTYVLSKLRCTSKLRYSQRLLKTLDIVFTLSLSWFSIVTTELKERP